MFLQYTHSLIHTPYFFFSQKIDYRRAPEHPFPLPLHDSIAAYLYLIQVENYDPSQIFIMGDSAGGGMAAATMTWLKDRPQYR